MSIETMTKLATVTVGSGGSATVTFSNIPQTYTDLKLLISGRTSRSAVYGEMYMRFNGSSTDYSARVLEATGSTTGSYAETSIRVELNGNTSTASTFGNAEFYIPNYTSSNYKSVSLDSVTENNATAVDSFFKAHMWSNTAAITQIDIGYGTGTISEFSTFTLYGIRNARKTAGNSIKATGGNISFDGTYVVHTFTSSGTFTPTAPIARADYLVVAGGGGGGAKGGGGGAGGLRSTVTATGGGGSLESALSLSPNTNYTVTVGAGGIASTTTVAGGDGSNSAFHTITSTGGGGGGTDSSGVFSGRTGGSGGGAAGGGYATSSSGGSGTANQGYAGANRTASAPYNGGGGGGAGAAGTGGTSAGGAVGGVGVATVISGTSTYYAGGGGGGWDSVNGGTGANNVGGLGGGGTGTNTVGTAGTANTGGGGGAGGWNGVTQLGAAGGSGIVIIRYKA